MSITTGTVLRIVASMLWNDGEVAQNVFNAVVTGGGGPWDEADIVADALAWLNTMYGTLTAAISDNLDGNSVTVYEYDSVDDDWDEIGGDSWAWNPASVEENLPRGCAALINMWTTDPDVQGKKYLAGIQENSAVDGALNAAFLLLMLDFADEWWEGFVGGTSAADWQPGIWSTKNTAFYSAIEHYSTSAIVAYQRRRKPNVGI